VQQQAPSGSSDRKPGEGRARSMPDNK
jgi:hypothetical protein